MKTAIFVAITIAALGAVGVTTSIMSSGILAYAQSYSQSGHSTLTSPAPGTVIQTFNGNLKCTGCGPIVDGSPSDLSGGGKVTCVDGNVVTQQGSPAFKLQASRTC
ncbi:MAG TPA: hypothetical protein VEL11_17525 [Candidatus Bathyarchaeia archaeon]|nr:hypothetical protein [Candidatus Bathyarchaeia archaeon]